MSELHDAIEELRRGGAARVEPVRFAYVQALARRVEGRDGEVQRLLRARLDAALADCRARVQAVIPAQAGTQKRTPWIPASAGMTRGATPLAQLTAQLQALSAARHEGESSDEPRRPHELPSVRRFRQAWSTVHTLEQVQQALARKPAQAGPLNSHALVVESLALMRSVSPDYLRRFLQYAESLQWLEQARAQLPRAQAKPAKPARRQRRKA